jgi:hypothetical protein
VWPGPDEHRPDANGGRRCLRRVDTYWRPSRRSCPRAWRLWRRPGAASDICAHWAGPGCSLYGSSLSHSPAWKTPSLNFALSLRGSPKLGWSTQKYVPLGGCAPPYRKVGGSERRRGRRGLRVGFAGALACFFLPERGVQPRILDMLRSVRSRDGSLTRLLR